MKFTVSALVLATALFILGCSASRQGSDDRGNSQRTSKPQTTRTSAPNPEEIRFHDQVVSNVKAPSNLSELVFVDTRGKRVELASYLGKKNVVLVFTEGFAGGMLCPFCKTQTSRLVANYDKFKSLDTEVLVVYPGSTDHLEEFIAAAKKTEKKEISKVPFPLLLDEKLSAVAFFKINSNLAC